MSKHVVAIVLHRSPNPNPNVERTDEKKGADADESRPPRLGDAHQHRRPSSRRLTQNRHRGGMGRVEKWIRRGE